MYTVQAQATAPNGRQAEWYEYEVMTTNRDDAQAECDALNRDHPTTTVGGTVWDVLWVVTEWKEGDN